MPDMTLFHQTFTSMQAATNIPKALIGLRDTAMIDSKVIELRDNLIEAQSSVLQAQAQQSALIQRVRDLEKEIADIKAWEKEKQRYQLIAPWRGICVYALKESSKGSEPPQWICEHCYQDGRKAILQVWEFPGGRKATLLKCSHCSFRVEMVGIGKMPVYV